MPNNCLSVLYIHIIHVKNKKVGLKVCVCGGGGGGHKHTIPPPPPHPPASYASDNDLHDVSAIMIDT